MIVLQQSIMQAAHFLLLSPSLRKQSEEGGIKEAGGTEEVVCTTVTHAAGDSRQLRRRYGIVEVAETCMSVLSPLTSSPRDCTCWTSCTNLPAGTVLDARSCISGWHELNPLQQACVKHGIHFPSFC